MYVSNSSFSLFKELKEASSDFHCIVYSIDMLVASSCEHDFGCCSTDVFSRVLTSSSCKSREEEFNNLSLNDNKLRLFDLFTFLGLFLGLRRLRFNLVIAINLLLACLFLIGP